MKQEKRKIVFINQATGYLTIDVINAFSGHFDEVALISGSIRVQDIELKEKVKWSKIIKYDRGNPRKKLFSWLTGTLQILFLLLFRYRGYEIFYITVPPFAYLISLLIPNKFSVLVFDVYPDVLKIYGLKRESLLFRRWQRWNRRLFKRAHRIFTISEGMAKLLSQYTTGERITIIPLWTGLLKAAPVPKIKNAWLQKLNLQGKFIVQYSGNIGYTHNVEVLIEIARRMKQDEWCHFLIIGRGDKVNHIGYLISKHSLTNCSMLPFQPDDVLIYSLAAADLGVVILDEKVADVSLPSKLFNLQAVGAPILGISPAGSELSSHLQKYNNGACFNQTKLDEVVQFIRGLHCNKEMHRVLSENSLLAARDFTIKNAQLYYHEYISQVL